MRQGSGPNRVIRGPQGVKLTLDPTEFFPDDPGNGVPASVTLRGHHSPFWWALGEGDCDGELLTRDQVTWLQYHEEIVQEFLGDIAAQFQST